MKTYAISWYLSSEQRERAARATYVLRREGDADVLRTVDTNLCPLGVALCMGESPNAFMVKARLDSTYQQPRLGRAAQEFIDAADSGRIPPEGVARALGVEP